MHAKRKIWVLAESSVCVAAATALSLVTPFTMPLGGSVTPFATLPIIIIGLRHGAKWGVLGAMAFSLVQLLLGMRNVAAVPVQTVWHMALCALLDYVAAYTVIGFTGSIAKAFKQPVFGIAVGIALTGFGRLLCSFLSGILIWGPFTPPEWNVWVYSLAYNAAWCLPDVGIALIACLLLTRVRALDLLPNPSAEEAP